MDKHILEQMVSLDQTCKEIEGIYHSYAKSQGLSDTVFWILYSLWEYEKPYPQVELYSNWSYPPQTINSALKVMEKQRLIRIMLTPGSKKNKQVCFTPEGKMQAAKIVIPFIQAEHDTLTALSEHEREMLLSIMQKYTAILKSKFD